MRLWAWAEKFHCFKLKFAFLLVEARPGAPDVALIAASLRQGSPDLMCISLKTKASYPYTHILAWCLKDKGNENLRRRRICALSLYLIQEAESAAVMLWCAVCSDCLLLVSGQRKDIETYHKAGHFSQSWREFGHLSQRLENLC